MLLVSRKILGKKIIFFLSFKMMSSILSSKEVNNFKVSLKFLHIKSSNKQIIQQLSLLSFYYSHIFYINKKMRKIWFFPFYFFKKLRTSTLLSRSFFPIFFRKKNGFFHPTILFFWKVKSTNRTHSELSKY